jgi:hypothetical protein
VTTPSIEFVDTGRAKWTLYIIGALFACSLYRALRGHPIDWFFYALLGAIAATSISTLAHGTRWRRPMTVLSYGLMTVTCVGIAFGLYVMG